MNILTRKTGYATLYRVEGASIWSHSKAQAIERFQYEVRTSNRYGSLDDVKILEKF